MLRCRRAAATLLLKRCSPVKLASAGRKGCLGEEKDNMRRPRIGRCQREREKGLRNGRSWKGEILRESLGQDESPTGTPARNREGRDVPGRI